VTTSLPHHLRWRKHPNIRSNPREGSSPPLAGWHHFRCVPSPYKCAALNPTIRPESHQPSTTRSSQTLAARALTHFVHSVSLLIIKPEGHQARTPLLRKREARNIDPSARSALIPTSNPIVHLDVARPLTRTRHTTIHSSQAHRFLPTIKPESLLIRTLLPLRRGSTARKQHSFNSLQLYPGLESSPQSGYPLPSCGDSGKSTSRVPYGTKVRKHPSGVARQPHPLTVNPKALGQA
jgi:hypothetical protein